MGNVDPLDGRDGPFDSVEKIIRFTFVCFIYRWDLFFWMIGLFEIRECESSCVPENLFFRVMMDYVMLSESVCVCLFVSEISRKKFSIAIV